MEVLTAIYGKDPKGTKDRYERQANALKKRHGKEFNFQLLFLNLYHNSAQMVMHNSCLLKNTLSAFMEENKEADVKESATIIREETLNIIQEAFSWPPKIGDLRHEKRQPPDLVRIFSKHVLNYSHFCESAIFEGFIWSCFACLAGCSKYTNRSFT